VFKQGSDKQSADPTVAIKKRMYGFELGVNEGDFDQWWQVIALITIRVYEFL
jgi:hypothetical protein